MLVAVFLLFLFFWQENFLPALPHPLFYANFIIVALVLMLVLMDAKTLYLSALALGVLSDIQSFYFFGAYTISLLVAVGVTRLAFVKFFTNRSLYAFISLTFIATLNYELARIIISMAAAFIHGISAVLFLPKVTPSIFGYGLLFNILSAIIAFYAINYFSRSFKAFFITK